MIRLNVLLQGMFRKIGFNITRASNTIEKKRNKILTSAQITVALDVGANTGQFSASLRKNGYKGRIISFEPLSAAFPILSRIAQRDKKHECLRLALGNLDQTTRITITKNLVSSSILDPTDKALSASAGSVPIGEESIQVSRLDSLSNAMIDAQDRVFLKIDAQGYEKEVILGAKNTLGQVAVIELESSLVSLYKDQPLLPEIITLLSELGFRLVWIERGFTDPRTGFILQAECIFIKDLIN